MFRAGHSVVVETDAGAGIGAADELYRKAGASIAGTAAEVFAGADMIVKVKEPQPAECRGCAKGKSCSLICIWRRIPSRPRDCWHRAARRSPTKPSPTPKAACRCWRR